MTSNRRSRGFTGKEQVRLIRWSEGEQQSTNEERLGRPSGWGGAGSPQGLTQRVSLLNLRFRSWIMQVELLRAGRGTARWFSTWSHLVKKTGVRSLEKLLKNCFWRSGWWFGPLLKLWEQCTSLKVKQALIPDVDAIRSRCQSATDPPTQECLLLGYRSYPAAGAARKSL